MHKQPRQLSISCHKTNITQSSPQSTYQEINYDLETEQLPGLGSNSRERLGCHWAENSAHFSGAKSSSEPNQCYHYQDRSATFSTTLIRSIEQFRQQINLEVIKIVVATNINVFIIVITQIEGELTVI